MHTVHTVLWGLLIDFACKNKIKIIKKITFLKPTNMTNYLNVLSEPLVRTIMQIRSSGVSSRGGAGVAELGGGRTGRFAVRFLQVEGPGVAGLLSPYKDLG